MKSRRLLIFFSIFIGLISAFSVSHALTSSINVDTLSDENDASCSDGDCSLRDAISVSSPGDTISFSVVGTITLNNALGPLTISKNLFISGPGAVNLAVTANHHSRIFYITAGDVVISGITINRGLAASGGGIYAPSNNQITIHDCVLSTNLGTNYGGAIYGSARWIIYHTLFIGNWTNYNNGGGAIYNLHIMDVNDSSFIGNASYDSGYGGAIFNAGTATIRNTTFADNYSSSIGGAIYNGYHESLTLINSTFLTNTANGVGGALASYQASVYLFNNTFFGNRSHTINGGAININQGDATVINTIVASSPNGGDCSGAFAVGSANNLSTDTTCSPGFSQVTPAQLVLGSSSGDPAYLPLNPGSLALDSGNIPLCPSTDQRGVLRPQDGDLDSDAVCDIGAYEAGSILPAFNFLPLMLK